MPPLKYIVEVSYIIDEMAPRRGTYVSRKDVTYEASGLQGVLEGAIKQFRRGMSISDSPTCHRLSVVGARVVFVVIDEQVTRVNYIDRQPEGVK